MFRLLQYIVALLSYIFMNTDEKVRTRKGFRLPAIIPIVLYNGKANWTAAMSFREYTKACELFSDDIINFKYHLFDVNRTGDEAIEPIESPLDAVFVVDKLCIREELTPGTLERWLDKKASGLSENDRNTLVNWMKHNAFRGEIPPEIKKMLENFLKKGDWVAMKTWAEVLEANGKRAGVLEGERNGRKQEALEIARRLKDKGRMTVDEIAETTGLTVDDILRL